MPNTQPGSGRKADPGALVTLLLGIIGAGALIVAGALALTVWVDTLGESTTPTTMSAATTVPVGTTSTTTTVTFPVGTTVPPDVALTVVRDESGMLEMSVPLSWTDVGSGRWTRGGVEVGVSLSASTDRQGWVDGWGTPGVFVGASDTISFDEALGDFTGSCTLVTADPFWIGDLPGVAEWWADCGMEGSDFVVAVATDGTTVVLVQLVTLGDDPGLAAALLATVRYLP